MTPSKSKSIAQKGFILFSYALYYAPFRPRFIPGKSREKDDKRNLEIKSYYHEDECENRAPGDSFFANITGSARGTNSRKHLTDSPADSVSTNKEKKKYKHVCYSICFPETHKYFVLCPLGLYFAYEKAFYTLHHPDLIPDSCELRRRTTSHTRRDTDDVFYRDFPHSHSRNQQCDGEI